MTPSSPQEPRRWLPRAIRKMRNRLATVLKPSRAIPIDDPFGRQGGKLRGPILWLGDLRKRRR